ncbi:MAG: PilN domain-containing protein [Thauera sp.]|jgi:type IV pilus assembly protein PilN|nr:PilN domain-containing protein [Thauera sp.]
MIRINLLPHRAEKRKQRRERFYLLCVAMLVLGAGIGFAVHNVFDGYIQRQDVRNTFLKNEIAKLDQEIAEIRRLQEQIDDLLQRKQVIENLQGVRASSVHLLNELASQMPDGVYLKSVTQSGMRISLQGYAQSNARVSHLMRNIENSAALERPTLVEVKAATVGGRRLSEFSLGVSLVRSTPEAEEAKNEGAAAQGKAAGRRK